ncbi:MAG: Ti-type conjugative transfer relaxase TraA [Caulobacteraceae bacterium]
MWVAIYHFSAKVISRANGSSAVAAAAYRSASDLYDERLGRSHNFSNKSGVIHSEILVPEGSPERWQDRAALWNEVEALEKRKDAQLAREVEFAIPRELDHAQGVALARDFVEREFVARGMVADLNVHWDIGPDGEAKPHAHVMLSMREVARDEVARHEVAEDGEFGFGKKVRDWNSREVLTDWREAWAEHVNVRLAELDIDARIDHRTLQAQAIELEPQNKIGPAGARREERRPEHAPEDAERAAEHRQIARRNGERIIEDPSVALDAITHQQSTFTGHDLYRFAHRHSDGADQFAEVVSAVKTSPELISLGLDGKGRERFTSREMLATEQRLERAAADMGGREGHGVPPSALRDALASGQRRGMTLSQGQGEALARVAEAGDLKLVVGYAGSGKSAMLGAGREAWEASGYRVRGATLSGIAAESLEGGSGIDSRTLASLEHSWAQGRDLLTSRDVLVIDEAGMIGSRQMERVLSAAEMAGAKVVLVGDPEQLQAIEAGAAFRALAERHGSAEITEIRRQHETWQRDATRELATGRTAEALGRYEAAGMVHAHETRDAARGALVDGWDEVRRTRSEASQLMLAHTRADVAELNQLARGRMREGGALKGEDQRLQTERGERAFALGDRLMFLRNERSLGVKNGTLGTVERVDGGGLAVRLDGPERRLVGFDLKDYAHIDHGYAATIHKSQGVTVDRAHLLATDGLDRHAAYVGLSRHREVVSVHYGAEDFKDREQLARTLGRERAKDTSLDYGPVFAERRGVGGAGVDRPGARAPLERAEPPVPRQASRFAGFRARDAAPRPVMTDGPEPGLKAPVRAYAKARADIERMAQRGLPALPHQEKALQQARGALEAASPDTAKDLRSALSRHPGLAGRIDQPGGLEAIGKAMAQEAKVSRDPQLRADRFVEDWSRLARRRAELPGLSHRDARGKVESQLRNLAQGLDRDPAVAKLLSARSKDLELPSGARVMAGPQISIGQMLERSLGPGRQHGPGLGIDL